MREGIIRCSCGKEFSFASMRTVIKCIDCGKEYQTADYPEEKKLEQAEDPVS